MAPGGPARAGDATSEFLRHHWRQPLAAQGAAPPGFSPLEASLEPAACGTCHPVQFGDWRQSTHAAASGPGVAGQLVEMWRSDPAAASGCYACHAPLAEQRPFVRTPAGFEPNPAFIASLAGQGVPCAACHVRGHQRFGPPRRDGSLASRVPRATLPHNGLTRTPAFLSAQFCRGCHQFEPNGPALGGKLLQDTYNEWRGEPLRAGAACSARTATCRTAATCGAASTTPTWCARDSPSRRGPTPSATGPGTGPSLRLTVTSTRVGHAFPTYVTPRVVLRIELIDAEGRLVAGSRTERIIAREVALDLSREYFDTRLRPGEAATLAYRPRLDARGPPGALQRSSSSPTPSTSASSRRFCARGPAAARPRSARRWRLRAARRSPSSPAISR